MSSLVTSIRLMPVIALSVWVCAAVPVEAGDPTALRLKSIATVKQRLVRLSDVLVRRDDVPPELADVDLIEVPATENTARLEREIISIRLQLAGYASSEFQLSGSDSVSIIVRGSASPPIGDRDIRQVSADSEQDFNNAAENIEANDRIDDPDQDICSDRNVERAICSALSEQFGIPLDTINAKLKRPLNKFHVEPTTDSGLWHLEVMTPSQPPLGSTTFTVRLWDCDRLAATQTALVDVRQQRRVLVTRRMLTAGSPASHDVISEETRFVDRPVDELSLSDLEGMTARRSIRSGELLSLGDFQKLTDNVSDQVLIKARDAVRITARRKSLQFVVPAAEALQSGRVGQLIRVRNLQSDRVITARVIAEGEVEAILE